MLPDGELVTLSVWDEGPDLLGALRRLGGDARDRDRADAAGPARAGGGAHAARRLRPHRRGGRGGLARSSPRGSRPAAIEMMDAIAIEAVEAAVAAGYPAGCGAVLIVELDGPPEQVEDDLARGRADLRASTARASCRVAASAEERARIWRGRKAAFAAMGRISPDYYVQDGVVPRTRLPEVLRRIEELSAQGGLRVGNVFHAGDGNLHPLVLYDGRVRRRGRARRGARRPDPRGLRRRRRLDHRRARRRHRQGVRDAAAVQRGRPRGDGAAAPRLRPARPRQPRQGLPDAAPVRRGPRPLPRAPARAGRPRGADRERAPACSSTSPAT